MNRNKLFLTLNFATLISIIYYFTFAMFDNGFRPKTNDGITLVKIKASECDFNTNPYTLKTKIISKTLKNDTLILKLKIRANCCMKFDPNFHYIKKNLIIILDDRKENMKEICACECCFQLDLYFTELKDTNFKTFIEKTRIYNE